MKTSFIDEIMDVLAARFQESDSEQQTFVISREELQEIIEYATRMESYTDELESEIDHLRWMGEIEPEGD